MSAIVYTLAPQAEIFGPIAAYLQAATGITSTFTGNGTHRPQQSWDWEPTSGTLDGPSRSGDYPRALHDVNVGFRIYCRAPTFDASWTMLEQLVSAIREKSGAAYQSASWEWMDASDESSTLKTSLVLNVTFVLPLFEHQLGGSGYEKATITAVGFDTHNTNSTDGVLLTPKD